MAVAVPLNVFIVVVYFVTTSYLVRVTRPKAGGQLHEAFHGAAWNPREKHVMSRLPVMMDIE